MKILLTGFDPFGGEAVNPAFEAVKLLPDTIAGAEIVKQEVPTEFIRAGEVLEAAIQANQPDVVICIGQAGGRSAITPEKVAINLMDGQLVISGGTIVTVLANIVIMAALTAFTGRTKFGKAMRAVSEDKGAAELMGINVNMTISMTFAIGSALAAIAGVLLCSAYPTLQPTTGSMPGIKAFTAAVFGGIGSIPGAMIGGVLLGVIEILGKAYVSTELGDALVFAVLILVLLVKPTGLLGKPVREKV